MRGGKKLTADQFAALIDRLRSAWEEDDRTWQRPVPDPPFRWDAFQQRQRNGLVIFSGDLFNPSVESSITRGAHMVPVINAMQVDCAVLGKYVTHAHSATIGILATHTCSAC